MVKRSFTLGIFYLTGGQHRNVQPFSDEDASIETMSHCSGYSDPSSFAEDGMSFKFQLATFRYKGAFAGEVLVAKVYYY